jgi:hypothetical protein
VLEARALTVGGDEGRGMNHVRWSGGGVTMCAGGRAGKKISL